MIDINKHFLAKIYFCESFQHARLSLHHNMKYYLLYFKMKKTFKSCVDKSPPLRAQALPAGAGAGGHDGDVPGDDDDTLGSPDTPHTCNTRQV